MWEGSQHGCGELIRGLLQRSRCAMLEVWTKAMAMERESNGGLILQTPWEGRAGRAGAALGVREEGL